MQRGAGGYLVRNLESGALPKQTNQPSWTYAGQAIPTERGGARSLLTKRTMERWFFWSGPNEPVGPLCRGKSVIYW
jgi:hypothetical protein